MPMQHPEKANRCAASLLLRIRFFFGMVFSIDGQTDQAEADGDDEYDSGLKQLSVSQCVSAYGGCDDGRKSAETGDQKPMGKPDWRQSDAVAEDVVRRSGEQKRVNNKEINPQCILKKTKELNLCTGNEGHHGFDAKTSNKQED